MTCMTAGYAGALNASADAAADSWLDSCSAADTAASSIPSMSEPKHQPHAASSSAPCHACGGSGRERASEDANEHEFDIPHYLPGAASRRVSSCVATCLAGRTGLTRGSDQSGPVPASRRCPEARPRKAPPPGWKTLALQRVDWCCAGAPACCRDSRDKQRFGWGICTGSVFYNSHRHQANVLSSSVAPGSHREFPGEKGVRVSGSLRCCKARHNIKQMCADRHRILDRTSSSTLSAARSSTRGGGDASMAR